jgi:hypothetical protein
MMEEIPMMALAAHDQHSTSHVFRLPTLQHKAGGHTLLAISALKKA